MMDGSRSDLSYGGNWKGLRKVQMVDLHHGKDLGKQGPVPEFILDEKNQKNK